MTTNITLKQSGAWIDFIKVGSEYVAISNNGYIARSIDLQDWTTEKLNTTERNWLKLVQFKDKLIALSKTGMIAIGESSSGPWRFNQIPSNQFFTDIAVSSNAIMAISNDKFLSRHTTDFTRFSQTWYSTTGTNWKHSTPVPQPIYVTTNRKDYTLEYVVPFLTQIVCIGGRFVMSGYVTYLLYGSKSVITVMKYHIQHTQVDAFSWVTNSTGFNTVNEVELIASQSKILAVTSNTSNVSQSYDGVTFTEAGDINNSIIISGYNIKSGKYTTMYRNKWNARIQRNLTVYDGTQLISVPNTRHFNDKFFDDTRGTTSSLPTTIFYHPTNNKIAHVGYITYTDYGSSQYPRDVDKIGKINPNESTLNPKFVTKTFAKVLLDESSVLLMTFDGSLNSVYTYGEVTQLSSAAWSDIIFAQGVFIAIARGSKWAYSFDGVNWIEPISKLPDSDWVHLVYGKNKVIAISSSGKIATLNLNSSVFEFVETTELDCDKSCVYTSAETPIKPYVIPGQLNPAQIVYRNPITSISFNGFDFVATTWLGQIWYSIDGIVWELKFNKFPYLGYITTSVAQNGIRLIASLDGRIVMMNSNKDRNGQVIANWTNTFVETAKMRSSVTSGNQKYFGYSKRNLFKTNDSFMWYVDDGFSARYDMSTNSFVDIPRAKSDESVTKYQNEYYVHNRPLLQPYDYSMYANGYVMKIRPFTKQTTSGKFSDIYQKINIDANTISYDRLCLPEYMFVQAMAYGNGQIVGIKSHYIGRNSLFRLLVNDAGINSVSCMTNIGAIPNAEMSNIKFMGAAGLFSNRQEQTISANFIGLNATDVVWGSLDDGKTWVNVNKYIINDELKWPTSLSNSGIIHFRICNQIGNIGFKTKLQYGIDITRLLLTTSSPADNSTEIDIDSNLTFTFNKKINVIGGKIRVKQSNDNLLFVEFDIRDPSITVADNTITIKPSVDFNYYTDYYVEIDPEVVIDDYGNVFFGLLDSTKLNFKTKRPPDVVPPYITSTDPINNSNTVAVDANITLTFSEPIVAVVNKTINIYDINDTVIESFDVTDPNVSVVDNKVTINPSNVLNYATQYYVKIDVGAFKDYYGNEFAGITDQTTLKFKTSVLCAITKSPTNGIVDVVWYKDRYYGLKGSDVNLYESTDLHNWTISHTFTVKIAAGVYLKNLSVLGNMMYVYADILWVNINNQWYGTNINISQIPKLAIENINGNYNIIADDANGIQTLYISSNGIIWDKINHLNVRFDYIHYVSANGFYGTIKTGSSQFDVYKSSNGYLFTKVSSLSGSNYSAMTNVNSNISVTTHEAKYWQLTDDMVKLPGTGITRDMCTRGDLAISIGDNIAYTTNAYIWNYTNATVCNDSLYRAIYAKEANTFVAWSDKYFYTSSDGINW